MELPEGNTVALIVQSEWRHLTAIEAFLGSPDRPVKGRDASALLFAKLLDASDHRGLWIECNTAKNKENPDRYPLWKFLIPWQYVLAVVLDPEQHSEDELRRKIGFSVPESHE